MVRWGISSDAAQTGDLHLEISITVFIQWSNLLPCLRVSLCWCSRSYIIEIALGLGSVPVMTLAPSIVAIHKAWRRLHEATNLRLVPQPHVIILHIVAYFAWCQWGNVTHRATVRYPIVVVELVVTGGLIQLLSLSTRAYHCMIKLVFAILDGMGGGEPTASYRCIAVFKVLEIAGHLSVMVHSTSSV